MLRFHVSLAAEIIVMKLKYKLNNIYLETGIGVIIMEQRLVLMEAIANGARCECVLNWLIVCECELLIPVALLVM